jgi:hypothetical protein
MTPTQWTVGCSVIVAATVCGLVSSEIVNSNIPAGNGRQLSSVGIFFFMFLRLESEPADGLRAVGAPNKKTARRRSLYLFKSRLRVASPPTARRAQSALLELC